MIAVAVLASEPASLGALARLTRDEPSFVFAGSAGAPAALLELAEISQVDIVLAAPRNGELYDWSALCGRFRMVVILDDADESDDLDAFRAGASAVLRSTGDGAAIVAAITAVAHGLMVARQAAFDGVLGAAPSEHRTSENDGAQPPLTRREREVLAAMADGLSNKAIARRLAISVHTAKFHVAAILEKLGADTRTEAVTKAAQRGIVML